MNLSFTGSDEAPGRDQLASSETELDQAELSLEAHHQQLEVRRKALDVALAGAKSSEEDGPLRTFAGEARLPAVAVQHPFDEAHAARAKAVAARRRAARVIAERLASFELELGHVEQQLAEAQAAERAHAEARRLEAARAAVAPAAPEPAPVAAAPVAGDDLAQTMVRALDAVPERPRGPRASEPKTGPERRELERVSLCAEISISSDSNFFTGFTSDVSEGGVFVATVNLVPVGTEIDLSFTLPGGQQVEGKGEVRWVREVNDLMPDVFPGLGVQFKPLAPGSLAAIRDFTAQREPMFFPEA